MISNVRLNLIWSDILGGTLVFFKNLIRRENCISSKLLLFSSALLVVSCVMRSYFYYKILTPSYPSIPSCAVEQSNFLNFFTLHSISHFLHFTSNALIFCSAVLSLLQPCYPIITYTVKDKLTLK